MISSAEHLLPEDRLVILHKSFGKTLQKLVVEKPTQLLTNTPLLFAVITQVLNSHACGVRYCVRWRLVSVNTIQV